MTVLDELNNINEYFEMDFVEFLEFVVRVAFVFFRNQGQGQPNAVDLMRTLVEVVSSMLSLLKIDFVHEQANKPKTVPQLSDEDYRRLID